MKNKSLALMIVLLVAIVGGSTLLYNSLTAEAAPLSPTNSTVPNAVGSSNTDVQPQEDMTMSDNMNEESSMSDTQESTPNSTSNDADVTMEESQTETVEDDLRLAAIDIPLFDYEGNETSLSDYYGKPIVLNFWASWCPPCQYEMPFFDEVNAEMGDEVQFLMVDMVDGSRETKKDGYDYITEEGYTFPVFYDEGQTAAYAYGVYSLPSTLFIDAEGYVVFSHVGAMEKETLLAYINDIGVPNETENVAEYMSMSPDEARDFMAANDDFRLIDVRTESEYNESHIDGAELIVDDYIYEDVADVLPDKTETLLIYCRSGSRSKDVVDYLVEQGYTNVYDLGGIIDWPYPEDIVTE